MSIGTLDLFHIVCALSAILVFAHVGGFLATKIGIPAIVGELVGGITLGATVFTRVWPEGKAWLIPSGPADPLTEPTAVVLPVLGFCSQVGLLMLLFIGGLQLRRLVTKRDAKAVGWIASLGVAVPVTAGLLALMVVDVQKYVGSANSLTALKIVLMIELAITSIPVITRIFLDLDLMNTRLARTVLSVAVLEDVMLYIALSIALGMANTTGKPDASIPAFLDLAPDSMAFIAWHVVASLLLLGIAAWGFGKLTVDKSGDETSVPYNGASRVNLIARRSPLAWTLATILVITGVAMFLGLAAMFGALVAGIIASNSTAPAFRKAQEQITAVGTGFFIPIYVALIGVSLDLIANFDWQLTVGILVFGSIVKYGGAVMGARLAGEKPGMANAMAISVNARGGPGLVVASTAFAAGIVNDEAFTSLILLSILTSMGSGIFLARMLSKPDTAAMIRADKLPPAVVVPSSSAASSSPTLV